MLVSGRKCWCAADSLVLKAMAIVLSKHLEPVIAPTCVHVTGHGGAKKAVRDVFHALTLDSHVMKSDVKSYYATGLLYRHGGHMQWRSIEGRYH